MTQANLRDTLHSIVLEYGFEQVEESLQEIRLSDPLSEETKKTEPSKGSTVTEASKRRPRATAPQYVAKMELPSEKRLSVVELAGRFQGKSFLPTFGDIVNFCHTYGIDEPASRSRTSAIPRVFKFIASMETDDIQRVIDEGMFSGPSRLGPIADAIRRSGRARATASLGPSSGRVS